MELNLDTGRLLVFVAGLCLFLVVETLAPARPWRGARWQRLGFHVGVAALTTVFIRVLAYVPFLLWLVYVEEQGWGLSRWLGLFGWLDRVCAGGRGARPVRLSVASRQSSRAFAVAFT